MRAKALKLGMLGFLMGMVVGELIIVVKGFAHGGELAFPAPLLTWTGSEAGALLAHTLLSGAYGFVPMAGTVLYELESWGMLRQAVVHYVTYTAAFLLVGIPAGWVGANPLSVAIVMGVFAAIHLAIWLVMYARYRREVAELNELLDDE